MSSIADNGAVKTAAERLTVWPFSADELHDDLRGAGLVPKQSTFSPECERYVTTASLR